MRSKIYLAAVLTAFFVGGGATTQGAWIYLKAELAQYLIARAWQAGARAESAPAPWPWADTRPVARLRVPARGIDEYVLAGAHGQALAFGPGHLSQSVPPGAPGNSVLAGHRDTHFRFLRELAAGDVIVIELPQGRSVRYRVTRSYVTDELDTRPLQPDAAGRRLTLITCYPFDALRAGGPQRYVVEARA